MQRNRYRDREDRGPRFTRPQRPPDEILCERAIQAERKEIKLTVRENHAGRFVRITEKSILRSGAERFNQVAIPLGSAGDLCKALSEMLIEVEGS